MDDPRGCMYLQGASESARARALKCNKLTYLSFRFTYFRKCACEKHALNVYYVFIGKRYVSPLGLSASSLPCLPRLTDLIVLARSRPFTRCSAAMPRDSSE